MGITERLFAGAQAKPPELRICAQPLGRCEQDTPARTEIKLVSHLVHPYLKQFEPGVVTDLEITCCRSEVGVFNAGVGDLVPLVHEGCCHSRLRWHLSREGMAGLSSPCVPVSSRSLGRLKSSFCRGSAEAPCPLAPTCAPDSSVVSSAASSESRAAFWGEIRGIFLLQGCCPMAWSQKLLSDHIPPFCLSFLLERVSDSNPFLPHSSLGSSWGMEPRTTPIPLRPPARGQKAAGAGGRVPGGC